jgi:hypothetical protein
MAKCIIEKFKMISLDFIATKIYYYNLGNELTSWSTGINSNSGGTVSNTKNSNNLSMTATVSGTGAANIGYSSDSKVNLANINTLYFDAEVTLTGASGKFLVGLDPNGRTDSNTYYSDLIVGVSSSGRQIYSINTSNITDSRYIKLIASSGNTSSSTVKVYKIWGE